MRLCPRQLALSVAALILGSGPLVAQPRPTWTQLTVPGPPGRTLHAMAYDEARQVVVLYGGYDGSTCLDDTWTWNGTAWTQHVTPGPGARRRHAMAYDATRGHVVLFGGEICGSGPQGDTWAWDGTQWAQLSPALAPTARYSHAMAFDEVRQEVIVFGGTTTSRPHNADTWTWNGSSWSPRFPATSPTARRQHAMAYHAAGGETVLFGGNSAGTVYMNDTWTWDGSDWTQRAPAANPQARFHHAMTYDSAFQIVVLFHGDTTSSFADTHWWDGTNWQNVSASSGTPPGRHQHAMAYDAARDAVVVFGGDEGTGTFSTDTWLHRTPRTQAMFTPYGQGCGPGAGLTLLNVAGGTPVVGRTFQSEVLNVPSSAVVGFMMLGSSNQLIGPIQLPLSLSFMGAAPCWLYQNLALADASLSLTGTTAQHSLPLPSEPALLGLHLFIQAAIFAPGFNPFGMLTSNGGDLLLGNT